MGKQQAKATHRSLARKLLLTNDARIDSALNQLAVILLDIAGNAGSQKPVEHSGTPRKTVRQSEGNTGGHQKRLPGGKDRKSRTLI